MHVNYVFLRFLLMVLIAQIFDPNSIRLKEERKDFMRIKGIQLVGVKMVKDTIVFSFCTYDLYIRCFLFSRREIILLQSWDMCKELLPAETLTRAPIERQSIKIHTMLSHQQNLESKRNDLVQLISTTVYVLCQRRCCCLNEMIQFLFSILNSNIHNTCTASNLSHAAMNSTTCLIFYFITN